MTLGKSYKDSSKSNNKIASDALEAIIGAIYLDKGLLISEKFIINLWKNYLIRSDRVILDPKTKLQEHSLKKYKKLPLYNLMSAKGPMHNPTYKISVLIENSKKFVGTGSSKQQAEQDGAEKLLKNLKIK